MVTPMPFDFNLEEGAIIPVDKPYGWTSADVVRKVKFMLQKKTGLKHIKVGHAGTLDPLATGLLVLCAGKATKQTERLQAEEKEYVAHIRLGATTPSFDLEKEIDHTYPFEHITREAVEQALQQFTGTQEQVPPVFSAKLIDGKRAYTLAREGKTTEMKPAVVTIYEMEIQHFALPKLIVRITCSKGTYIRSLARDLGVALQSGGHLTDLRRTRSGKYHISNACSIAEIENKLKNWKVEKDVVPLRLV
ncbi:MAG: tRNA pseudouridine(55) synthase TruB [Prevotellaceae bacterium]|jgi:tRNA pseudouridine55 synthase|nr:tRNA pseudouridine(55) synthase TruB [Prevotellaceae bacterium]